MWVNKSEYETLKKLNAALEKETKRLAELISAGNPDCRVGKHCKECSHVGYDEATVTAFDLQYGHEYFLAHAGKVMYCRKHLQDNTCPGFENALTES